MIFSLEVNKTGTVGFSCTISYDNIRITGKENNNMTTAIHSAVDIAVESGLINDKSVQLHMARGNGLICRKCKNDKTVRCSYKINYECFTRVE